MAIIVAGVTVIGIEGFGMDRAGGQVEDRVAVARSAVVSDFLFGGGGAHLEHDMADANGLSLERWCVRTDSRNLAGFRQMVNVDAV